MMKTYDFTLNFSLHDEKDNPESYIDTLAESGCDDAIIGIGSMGQISLNFLREANTAREAITSAIENVRTAIPNAEFLGASPDVVGVTEIAEFIGTSRQNIRMTIQRYSGSFPKPSYSGLKGGGTLWHLNPVLEWFKNIQNRQIQDDLLELADFTRKLNLSRELETLGEESIQDVRQLL